MYSRYESPFRRIVGKIALTVSCLSLYSIDCFSAVTSWNPVSQFLLFLLGPLRKSSLLPVFQCFPFDLLSLFEDFWSYIKAFGLFWGDNILLKYVFIVISKNSQVKMESKLQSVKS